MRIAVRLILLSLPVIVAFQAAAQKKDYQVTAISFYNFENLFDTEDDLSNWGDDEFLPGGSYRYTRDIYEKKLSNLATVISELGTEITPDGPAMIGTAEIENARVLQDLISQPQIRDRGYEYVHFDGPDARGIDVALLYNPKYFSVLTAQPMKVHLNEYGEKGGRTRDILYVTGLLAGDTVHVFVNHWPSRRGGEAATAHLRARAAGVFRHAIDSILQTNANARVMVMGDLNDDPLNASVTTVLGAKHDSKKIQSSDLYNPFVTLYRKGVGTLGYNDSWSLFDQIIISGSLVHGAGANWRLYKAEVFNRGFLKNNFGRMKGYPHRSFEGYNWMDGYSDHFPTLIYLIKPLSK